MAALKRRYVRNPGCYAYSLFSDALPDLPHPPSSHQTRHALCLTIGAFALHENAFWNSGMLETGPFTR